MGKSRNRSDVVAAAVVNGFAAEFEMKKIMEEVAYIREKIKKLRKISDIKKKIKKLKNKITEEVAGIKKKIKRKNKKIQEFSNENDSSSKDNPNNSLIQDASPAITSKSAAKQSTLSAPLVQSTKASKTVIARNVAIALPSSDVIDFFKKAGEVVDARYEDRATWRIKFADVEAAKKALELDGQYLGNREVVVSPKNEGTGASKTLVAKNLSSSITKSDVIEFFKQAGEIVDVRFSLRQNGELRGYCHIEFATEEAAKKAAKLNGECLLDHPIVLGFTRETIFVRGFDPSLKYHQIRSSLEELFSTCGKILWMDVPTVPYTDVPLGKAFIEFYDIRSFPKALAMNGHKLGDFTLRVEDAIPLRFDVRPTGGRRRINGRPVGPYGPYAYRYFPDRGYGGAGIGKNGSIYHQPQGKRTTFDGYIPKGEQEGHKLGDSNQTVEDAMPLQSDVKPMGARRINIKRYVGPIRGYGGAGLGKHGSICHLGKKTTFDDDSSKWEQEGQLMMINT